MEIFFGHSKTDQLGDNAKYLWHLFATPDDPVTEFRQTLQVQSHLEMPRILVQLGHIQRT